MRGTTEGARTRPRIVFPEAEDPRIREAAARLRDEGILEPVLVAATATVRVGLPGGIRVVAPEGDALERAARLLEERRGDRKMTGGMTRETAPAAAREPLLFADLLVAAGEAEGSVAGAAATTGAVVRAALLAIGARPGVSRISGAFFMEFAGVRPPLLFADGAVQPEPGPAELAEIAILTAETAETLFGLEPRVALLSFSTRGSAEDRQSGGWRRRSNGRGRSGPTSKWTASCRRMRRWSRRWRRSRPRAVRSPAGPMCWSSPTSPPATSPTSWLERLAGASATGPILQGLAAPANDLSRGAGVRDIIRVAHLTARAAGGSPGFREGPLTVAADAAYVPSLARSAPAPAAGRWPRRPR